jgi:phage tail sheath protein FI
MSFDLGLNVVEVDGRATPSIQPAATSVTGFVIRSQRGVEGDVVRVTNWSQFLERFGSYLRGAYGAYAVRGFFDNGGATAYITRVVNTTAGTATAATITSNPGPWALAPGGELTFDTNLSGAPVTATFDASGAVLVGGTGPFNLDEAGAGRTLALTVNGAARGPYQFDAADFGGGLGAATAAEVAAVLNREFPGIQAFVDPGDDQLRIRSDRRGTGATLATGGSAAGELGLGADASGSGNVADIDAVTPAEARATIASALEPAPLGFSVTVDDERITIEHPSTGADQTIQVVADAADTPTAFGFDTDPHAGTGGDPAVEATAAGATIGDLAVGAGYRGRPDRGAWGNDLRVEIVANGAAFDLIVYRGDDDDRVTLETWPGLSMDSAASNFAESIVNDEVAGSKYITVNATGAAVPPPTPPTPLEDGDDGQFPPGTDTNAYAGAFARFETINIQLLCCPESAEPDVVSAGLGHAANLGDRMYVGHTPFNNDMGAALTYGSQFQANKVYGALYFPWIQINDPIGSRIWVPPTGHLLGVYARTERERGIWKAPAGNAALVQGALDVRYHITNRDHTALVKEGSVNAVRFIAGQGIVVDSSRTLSTNPLWIYVNVRLLFNFVKSSLMGGLRWTVQEPNTSDLWNKVKFNSVTPFLLGLWRRGAFGPGAPDDVFTVKVDAENNTPADIQQGRLNIEVYFYPSRPAETIVITVGQQEGGATASES